MTRTVSEKAIQLLTKSVSDIAGEERLIADALVSALKSSEQIFADPVQFDLQKLTPVMGHQKYHHTAIATQTPTVH
jgi:hypothetical protein